MADEAEIRERRRRTNELIAAHQGEALRPFFDPEVKLIRGDGTLVVGVDAALQVFETQFKDPAFVTYDRTTANVSIDRAGTRAAETGTWVGSWRAATGETTRTGQYLVVWKKVRNAWIIESELYVALK